MNNYEEIKSETMTTKTIRFNKDNLENEINNYIIENRNNCEGNLSLAVKNILDNQIDILFTWSTYQNMQEEEIVGVKLVETYKYETIKKLEELKSKYQDEIKIDILARFFINNYYSEILVMISRGLINCNQIEETPKQKKFKK